MNEKVPYIVHESALARMDRVIKRLWITIVLLIVIATISNLAWVIYESQYEDVVTTTTTQDVKQDSESGNNNFVGGDYNGNAKSSDND